MIDFLKPKTGLCMTVVLCLLLCFFSFSFASEWKNPKEFYGDPNIVRLPRGSGELSKEEKQEIEKYGFTGLELITYAFFNENPGYQNRESGINFYNISSGGKVLRTSILDRNLYLFKKLDMLSLEMCPPGKVWRR